MPQGGIQLSLAGPDDWPLWRKLRLEALTEAPYAFSSKLAEWQGQGDLEIRWRKRLSDVPLNIIANFNGIAGGMVSATAPDQDGTVELISMWVAPVARGQGVGDSLVSAAIDWARAQAASQVVLAVVESNQRANDLYRRNQFIDVGAVVCSCSGSESERQMMREL